MSGASAAARPLARLREALRGLALPALEPAARRSYRREMQAQVGLPVAFGLVEGGFVGVVADKAFQAHPALIALITAAPMFGNLSSVLWARLAEGRRKVPLLTAIQAALVALVLAMAALPRGPAGAPWLAAAVVAARLLIGGVVTLRSLVWTLNYPGPTRARVTARLSVAASLGIAGTSLLGGAWLDAEPGRFPLLYLGGAALAAWGVALYARIELRGEEDRRAAPAGAEAGTRRMGALRALRADPDYARYLGWQFLLGVSNMMVEAPLIVLVSRELGASYVVSSALTVAVPFGLGTLTMPLWAGYLDRVHVARFRTRHGWLWVASLLLTFAGAAAASLAWVAAGRAVLGVARGGGILAWQLGHNDFVGP
ncbi:MAG: MFS transporter, partial [Myxococcota bacterium]|nr:MFS transporter [Myxococcota bacterium]